MRAAVTAIGLVTALGDEPAAVRARVAAGESAVVPAPFEGSPVAACAPVEKLNLRPWLTRRKDQRLMARPSQLLLPAAARALVGWEGDRAALGLYFGVGREPADSGESNEALSAMALDGALDLDALSGRGRDLYPPLLPLKSLPNMALAHVSIQLGVMGENATFTGGSEAGVQALREAIAAVVEGRCPAVLAGASDSWVDGGSMRDRARLGRFEPPGEAAVVLRLEPEDAPGVAGRALFLLERGAAGLDPAPPPAHRAALGDCGAADALVALILELRGVIGGDGEGSCCEVRWNPC